MICILVKGARNYRLSAPHSTSVRHLQLKLTMCPRHDTHTSNRYAVKYISGGHLNPAFSLAALMSGHIDWLRGVSYIVMQVRVKLRMLCSCALMTMAVLARVLSGGGWCLAKASNWLKHVIGSGLAAVFQSSMSCPSVPGFAICQLHPIRLLHHRKRMIVFLDHGVVTCWLACFVQVVCQSVPDTAWTEQASQQGCSVVAWHAHVCGDQ